MARHRSPSGAQDGHPDATVPIRAVDVPGMPRLPPPPAQSVCARATIAALAAGGVVAAGQTLVSPLAVGAPARIGAVSPVAQVSTAADAIRTAIGAAQLTPAAVAADLDPATEVDVASLTKATKLGEQLARQTTLIGSAEADGARDVHIVGRSVFVRPAVGTFTSGFGGRWGAFHYGVDIANAIGTPIYAVADGVVEDAGPASGFGLWVVLRHADGTHTVYGHVNRMFVKVGQVVKAGEQIAEIGNRGESTGPHLHFEVWAPNGTKINPLPWLLAHGIDITQVVSALPPIGLQ